MKKNIIKLVAAIVAIASGVGISINKISNNNEGENNIVNNDIHAPKLLAKKGEIELYANWFVFNQSIDDWEYKPNNWLITNYNKDTLTIEYLTKVPNKKKELSSYTQELNADGTFEFNAKPAFEKIYLKEIDLLIDNPLYNKEKVPEINLIDFNFENGYFNIECNALMFKAYVINDNNMVCGLASTEYYSATGHFDNFNKNIFKNVIVDFYNTTSGAGDYLKFNDCYAEVLVDISSMNTR